MSRRSRPSASGCRRDVRARVHLALLPMEDIEENAAIVNALQRRSDVICQKSLAEGFGLTVAEAMWKARPVVASRGRRDPGPDHRRRDRACSSIPATWTRSETPSRALQPTRPMPQARHAGERPGTRGVPRPPPPHPVRRGVRARAARGGSVVTRITERQAPDGARARPGLVWLASAIGSADTARRHVPRARGRRRDGPHAHRRDARLPAARRTARAPTIARAACRDRAAASGAAALPLPAFRAEARPPPLAALGRGRRTSTSPSRQGSRSSGPGRARAAATNGRPSYWSERLERDRPLWEMTLVDRPRGRLLGDLHEDAPLPGRRRRLGRRGVPAARPEPDVAPHSRGRRRSPTTGTGRSLLFRAPGAIVHGARAGDRRGAAPLEAPRCALRGRVRWRS